MNIELNTRTKYIEHGHRTKYTDSELRARIEHVQKREHEGGHEHQNEQNKNEDSTSNSKSASDTDQNSTLNTMNSGDIDTLFVADVFNARNSFFSLENKFSILLQSDYSCISNRRLIAWFPKDTRFI